MLTNIYSKKYLHGKFSVHNTTAVLCVMENTFFEDDPTFLIKAQNLRCKFLSGPLFHLK